MDQSFEMCHGLLVAKASTMRQVSGPALLTDYKRGIMIWQASMKKLKQDLIIAIVRAILLCE
jgi:hypothetical protein